MLCIHTHTHRQLYMFSELMQRSPEIMLQLGITPEALQLEVSKLENVEKLKVQCMCVCVRMYVSVVFSMLF